MAKPPGNQLIFHIFETLIIVIVHSAKGVIKCYAKQFKVSSPCYPQLLYVPWLTQTHTKNSFVGLASVYFEAGPFMKGFHYSHSFLHIPKVHCFLVLFTLKINHEVICIVVKQMTRPIFGLIWPNFLLFKH